MTPEALRQYLEFYRDLGIKTLWVRPAAGPAARPAIESGQHSSGHAAFEATGDGGAPAAGDTRTPAHAPAIAEFVPGDTRTPSGVSSPAQAMPGSAAVEPPPLAPAGDTLEQILADIGDCRRCKLHQGRNKLVFGQGDPKAKIVFVGEGPGADEDAQGLPFVGRAGQLLTQMIENTAHKEGIPLLRKDVYICNVVKCRPPGNRTPEPDEMAICGQYLYRQIETIRPKAICILGGTAMKAILNLDGITKRRGDWYKWRDFPVMVTYHPSYLLRSVNPQAKREAWEDLKKVLHFVYD